jgi:hypothetical protein
MILPPTEGAQGGGEMEKKNELTKSTDVECPRCGAKPGRACPLDQWSPATGAHLLDHGERARELRERQVMRAFTRQHGDADPCKGFDGDEYCNCEQSSMFREALFAADFELNAPEPNVVRARRAILEALLVNEGLRRAYHEQS